MARHTERRTMVDIILFWQSLQRKFERFGRLGHKVHSFFGLGVQVVRF